MKLLQVKRLVSDYDRIAEIDYATVFYRVGIKEIDNCEMAID